MKIAIIGSGISGLSMAQILKDSGHEVIVFEKKKDIGGLIKCERIQDCLFHKVGGHVFNSKNQNVLNWFWSHFNREEEFVKAKRNAKIFFRGNIIGYPIENYIYHFEKKMAGQIIAELLELQQKPKRSPFQYGNFEEFLQENFGHTLYEQYFKPYNVKIWQTDLSKVSMDWLEGKLPMPNLLDIIQSNVLREEEDDMIHSTFYYPKTGGSQFIVDRLSNGIKFKTNSDVSQQIEEENEKFTINGEPSFDKIVYCGDIRSMPPVFKNKIYNTKVDISYVEQLKSNGTSNLFCETDDNNISWLYIPELFTKAHRIIYTGNFAESNNRGSERKTCVVEFSGKVDYELMVEEIKKLPGNLRPLAHNYEENSYVIQDKRTRSEVGQIKNILAKDGIYLLGRFAEWEYYNMDKCIENAFNLSSLINGQ